MRQRIIKLHLNYLRIDHDETQLFWRKSKEHAGDERVDADTFPAARGASYEQMGHLRQIGDDGFAIDVFTERQRNFRVSLRLVPVGRLQEFT